ncbi:hypothetical protein GG804_01920 [Sphingomonas histidinilytica]|uniref:hypothetical protein n=1 Tax=Sphingomonadales TaxID=204457 RepID=UPI0007702615|nr:MULTISPECIES: hypothetical protein [Sphingomonadaceae]AMK23263.1 hypothetical protein K426_11635 [Sphingobium sp. TKS]MBO9375514.1 hypothetical protein [Rhizorhabdus histidinilytica]MCF8709060.1 hypothetical protein [Rhizorhapis sp. SPR117]
MGKFFATARYCTRSGNLGRWSDTIDADDIDDALRLAQAAVERRHRGASKIDVTVSPDLRPSSMTRPSA